MYTEAFDHQEPKWQTYQEPWELLRQRDAKWENERIFDPEESSTLSVCVFILPACLYKEAGVFLSMERAGVTVEMTGLPLPGDGTESNGQENTHTDRLDIFNKKNCFTPNRYVLGCFIFHISQVKNM